MKTKLTRKELYDISKEDMSFDFRSSKNGMLEWVVAGLNGDNKSSNVIRFANKVMRKINENNLK